MARRLLPGLLVLSGASALVLEVAWFRRTAQVAGGSATAMAAVLAAVIGGMALGAWLLGPRSDRSTSPLRLYGVLELIVALGAVLSPWLLDASVPLFTALQRVLGGAGVVLPIARFGVASLLLALPAIAMGGTLPAAAAAVRAVPAERGRAIGLLYACNTLGAVAGTLLAGFVLLPAFGLANTMRLAAVLSVAAGLVAISIRGARASAAGATPLVVNASPHPRASRAIALYAASGFLGLVAEVCYTRSLVLVTGSTTYSFSLMLAVFLLGIGLGSLLGRRLARTARDPVARLEVVVAATGALLGLGTLLMFGLPRLFLQGYLFIQEYSLGFGGGLLLRALLVTLVMLPGALGLGAAFPLAIQVAGAHSAGAGTGRLYAANTLASILGSTLAAFLFVPLLGPHYGLATVAVGVALFAVLPARRPAGWVLLAITALGLVPPSRVAFERLHSGVYFTPNAWVLDDHIDENAWEAGVDLPWTGYGRDATITIWRWYGKCSLLVNGKAVASDQVLADEQHLSLLGHLPMLAHPDPRRVLVVGLGMGTTWRAVESHAPETCTVVEIEPEVVKAARYLGVEPGDVVIADARTWLRATDRVFDVITTDPIHPWVRGSGDLYTVEYWESCRAHLAPGGLVCHWLPVYQMGVEDLRAVLRTFASVFRCTAYYGGGDLVLLGTNASLVPSPARLERPRRETGLEPDLTELKVADHDRIVRLAGPGPLLTEDALRLEFSTPRQLQNQDLAECFVFVRRLWGDPPVPYNHVLDAQEAWARGNGVDAREATWAALRVSPRHAFGRRFAGELYLMMADDDVRKGALERAAKTLTYAEELLGDDSRVTGVRADLEAARGDSDAARALYEKLLEAAPDSDFLRRKLAR